MTSDTERARDDARTIREREEARVAAAMEKMRTFVEDEVGHFRRACKPH